MTMADVLERSGETTLTEGGGVEVILDVLDRLHQLRATLRQCHQRVERVDSRVHALHTQQKDLFLSYIPRKPHDLGSADVRGDHKHPEVFNFPEGTIHSSQHQEAITDEEPEVVEGEQEDENKTKNTKQDSMSEVREAEEHLLQTEWTEVVGELTESFELAEEEVEEEEEEGGEEGQSNIEDGASGSTQRPPLRRQEQLEIEDYDPNLRLRNNSDGDRVEEGKPFDSSHSPNLLATEKQDINGIFPKISKELCGEDVVHSALETDDHESYPTHCNEDPVDRSFGLSLNVTHSLEAMQETLDLLRDYITLLNIAVSGSSYKQPEHHRQGTSTIPSEVLTVFDLEKPFEGLHEDTKTVLENVEEPSTKLSDQDLEDPRPREGEGQRGKVITETSLSSPEPKRVKGIPQRHENVIFHRGRKQDLRNSLTTMLVVFLVMFALLFLACCLLLVVPVVTVSVRTTGGPVY